MRPSAFPGDRDKGILRLHAWVMIVTVGLTVVVALLATRSAAQYTASAEILVDPTLTPSGNYIQPSMPTEQRVATSTDVVETAAARLGITSAQALSHLSVSVPLDTQVLVVTYTADTPAAAVSGANAVCETYINARNPKNGKNPVASLVSPPKLPSAPTSTNYPVVLGVAVIGGLLLGFAIAWAWDRVRGRIRTVAEAEVRTDLPALAMLPRPSAADGPQISAGDSHLDSLAARVLSQVEDTLPPSLLVTGVDGHSGTTAVAVGTSLALARMGRVVILVTADQDVIAQLSPDRGDAKPVGIHVVSMDEWNESGLAAAEVTNLLTELHDRLPEALLVIDGPPAWQSAGLALRADKVLLVVGLGRSSRSSTSAAAQALDHCIEKVLGLVITTPHQRARAAVASAQSWAAVLARKVTSRIAPPAPTTPVAEAPVAAPGPAKAAPRLNGSTPKSAAADRVPVRRVSVSRPSGGPAKSPSS